jgi:hypothetical protein
MRWLNLRWSTGCAFVDYDRDALDRHFGKAISVTAGPTFQPVVHGFAVMLIFWLILFWMYHRRISLRI